MPYLCPITLSELIAVPVIMESCANISWSIDMGKNSVI